MAVAKRVRFEILRRDGYACRYCGAKAPDVELTVDHVNPVALGGSDDPSNLTTACQPCNSGKSSTGADEHVVQAVADDAERWAAAMQEAARLADAQAAEDASHIEWFETFWYTTLPNFCDLPDGFGESVLRFRSQGMTPPALIAAMEIAARADHVARRQRWRYFCGICSRQIEALQRTAAELLQQNGGPDGA